MSWVGDGFDLSPAGVLTFQQDGRTVLTTDGRLVTLLPSSSDYGAIASPETITLNFPDVPKGWAYNWRATSGRIPGTGYSLGEHGDGYVAAKAQEWSDTTILAAAPSTDCNYFAARVRISRTTAPTKTWFGNAIVVKPPTGEWIPFTGSVLLEEMLGLTRTFSLYIDGSGNLVRKLQQSVSVGPYYQGNETYGAPGISKPTMAYLGPGGLPAADGNQHNAGEWSIDDYHADGTGTCGLPVYNDPASMSTNVTYTVNDPFTPSWGGYCRRTSGNGAVGGSAASVTDTTNYASVYLIDIAGSFGRISS